MYRCDNVSRTDMVGVAKFLSSFVRGGDVIVLVGDLGTGKTTLVAEIGRVLNSKDEVTSPTFAIVAEYALEENLNGIEKIIHVDTYRLSHVNELYDLGFETIFDPQALTIIEWGERIEEYIDRNHLRLTIEETNRDSRSFILECVGDSTRCSEIDQLEPMGWHRV